MPPTIIVRAPGGALFELDVPADGTMAKERLDQQIERGDLAIVTDPVKWVEVPFGVDAKGETTFARHLVVDLPAPEPDPDPAPPAEVELTAEGLAALTRDQLVVVAREAGIAPGNKGAPKLVAEILEVVAFADAVDQAAATGDADDQGS
jgi:hypothetical protein